MARRTIRVVTTMTQLLGNAHRPGKRGIDPSGEPAATRQQSHVAGASATRSAVGRIAVVARERLSRSEARLLALGLFASLCLVGLEYANLGGTWQIFEDIQLPLAPGLAALALAVAAPSPGRRQHRVFVRSLSVALTAAALSNLLGDVPDFWAGASAVATSAGGGCAVFGAMLGVATLVKELGAGLKPEARAAVLMDGLIIMVAGGAVVLAIWLFHATPPGSGTSPVLADPTSELFIPLVAAGMLAAAGALVMAGLALRVRPRFQGVWAMTFGILMMSLAWCGWLARSVAGTPDTIEIWDLLFPLGAVAVAYGGISWSLTPGAGEHYARVATAVSDWLPIVAVVSCGALDIMPRQRPLDVDPIAITTFAVIGLTMARQRLLQGDRRQAEDRLGVERKERATATLRLTRLEAAASLNEAAARVCEEALLLDAVDRVEVLVFHPAHAAILARGGLPMRPLAPDQPLPADHEAVLREKSKLGLWLEGWSRRPPDDDFEAEMMASGLRAEAIVPMSWNEQMVGAISFGAVSDSSAGRLADRTPALVELGVMAAGVLGPRLVEVWRRDALRSEIQAAIDNRAFSPVFQPIVELKTGRPVGFEALTRFIDGARPDERFLAASQVGMMIALETACLTDQLVQARALPGGTYISLNVSPALATQVEPLLALLEAADREVVLEVTERLEIDDYGTLVAALDLVRRRPHTRLAVDDTGAGYDTLVRLVELNPHFMKLDISLVRNVNADRARQALVKGMTFFAAGTHCSLIAEGIETPAELATLQALGVKFGQGYLLGRPSPVDWFASHPANPAAEHQLAERAGASPMSEFQVVVCQLGRESYGLDIGSVYEIIRFQECTAVPASPGFVNGVINLRGRIIPVVDLRGRFGMAGAEPTNKTRIVVAGSSSTRVGLIVDSVSEVLLLPSESVEHTPGVAAGADAEYLRGIAKLGDRLVLLLELDGLLGLEDQTALAGAA